MQDHHLHAPPIIPLLGSGGSGSGVKSRSTAPPRGAIGMAPSCVSDASGMYVGGADGYCGCWYAGLGIIGICAE